MKRSLFLLLLTGLTLISPCFAQDEEETPKKTFAWKAFEIKYPETWTATSEFSHGGMNVKFMSKRKDVLAVIVTLRDDMPTMSEEEQSAPTQNFHGEFGHNLALDAAEKHPERIITTWGLINFSDYYDIVPRFQVSKPGSDVSLSFESFFYVPPDTEKYAAFGAIVSHGNGKYAKQSQENINYLLDAYSIVQSIVIKKSLLSGLKEAE